MSKGREMMMEAIQIVSSFEERVGSHLEIELFYLISGEIGMKLGEEVYDMVPKDIIVVNADETYSWKIKTESPMNKKSPALACKVKIAHALLKEAVGRDEISFVCNSVKYPDEDYGRLRYILDILVKKWMEQQSGLVVRSMYYTLWECVKNQFSRKTEPAGPDKDDRMEAIQKEIHENYGSDLSLRVMAEKWYMSESAFSRYFKKQTGMKFVDYIRKVRLERAGEELRRTRKSITEIAFDCGFSNPSVFNKSFREYYQMAPGAYRLSGTAGESQGQDPKTLEELKKYFDSSSDPQTETISSVEIEADVTLAKVYQDPTRTCLNAGMLSELLEGKAQADIRTIVEKLHIRYLRVSQIFGGELQIRSGHDANSFNFEKLDVVFDFLTSLGVIPLIDLPERLRKAVIAIGNDRQVIRSSQEPVVKSMEEWMMLLRAFLEHIIDRYTVYRVKSWRFEIWYDIEQRTGAGKLPYMRLYERTAGMIRQYIPEAKIGAGGLNVEMDADTLREQLLFWKEKEERPDFLTLICYPYQVEKKTAHSFQLKDIRSDTHFIQREIRAYKQMLRELEYPETPVWIIEWNTSLSERNIYNDSCAKACHMLTQMTDAAEEVEALAYSTVSDWHASGYDVKAPFTGATGLLTKDGLFKPAYYAMEFWSFVGERIVSKGENYIVSARGDGTYSILAFHPKSFSYRYRLRDENEIQVQDLPYLFQDREKLRFSFVLRNITNGKRKISHFCVSEAGRNILSEWKKLDYAETLSPFEISYLKRVCVPQMEVRQELVKDHQLRIDLELEANELRLILIF